MPGTTAASIWAFGVSCPRLTPTGQHSQVFNPYMLEILGPFCFAPEEQQGVRRNNSHQQFCDLPLFHQQCLEWNGKKSLVICVVCFHRTSNSHKMCPHQDDDG